ncbi:DNA-binding XRE family transcriptional regulator [Azospirillum lipoferum]|uniref:helix-turn-helix domain-containing protein n=1 Tax=Azospirillum TaxID=191 RepID=UPI001B3C0759|nr:DNA-binding XRE family transcriptional regulator [Azospirillum lipoferum]
MATQAFGRVLRRLRVLRGMKQGHLAELLGVTQATVSRWERGELPMAPDRIAAAERLLAAPPVASQDAALRRLVETSPLKLHMICDHTHRLLAGPPGGMAGRPVGFPWPLVAGLCLAGHPGGGRRSRCTRLA